jgi:hypothetical protein
VEVGREGNSWDVLAGTVGTTGTAGKPKSKNGNSSHPNPNSSSDQNTDPGQSPAGNSNPDGLDSAIALKDQSETEWYQESVSIEQSWIQTAQSVLVGDMTPWPRTPLTPAGTPGDLVGEETFFSSHTPGFKQQAPPVPTP